MISIDPARPGVYARFAAILIALVVSACGSGGVSGPPPVVDPARITILPDTAVLYSGLPTTFTISGGTGAYIVSSSNQSVVQVSGAIPRNTVTVIPANVTVDTSVTLTVRDTGSTPVATAALTVRPGTVSNDIQITPTANQGGNCSPAVCSGGDAIISTTISQGGNPLPARGVRLEVISGDFRFITNPPGAPEFLEASTVVVSDQNGGVQARLRALPGAANQTAVVQVTELGTLAFRRATFQIAQATGSSPGFFTTPSTVGFAGPNDQTCATSGRADVYVFGGTPPYSIGNSGSAFVVSQNVVASSGGSFYISPTGQCVDPGIAIPVVDSAGRTTIVTASNVRGDLTVPALTVAPTTVNISECSGTATVAVAGGLNTFTASSGSPAIVVSPNVAQRVITISRTPNTSATSPISVGVASGSGSATVTVNLTGDALTTRCDGSTLSVSPSSVQVAGCGAANVVVSGGQPPYFPESNNSAVSASMVSPNVVRIQRNNPSAALNTPGTVTIFDSNGALPRVSRTVSVDAPGNCP